MQNPFLALGVLVSRILQGTVCGSRDARRLLAESVRQQQLKVKRCSSPGLEVAGGGYCLGRLKINSDSKWEINSQPSFPSEFKLVVKSGLIFVLTPFSSTEARVPP